MKITADYHTVAYMTHIKATGVIDALQWLDDAQTKPTCLMCTVSVLWRMREETSVSD